MKKVVSYMLKICRFLNFLIYRFKMKKIVKRVRSKERINVLFVLGDLSLWKTEGLLQAMLQNNRFNPIIGTTLIIRDNPTESIRKYNSLLNYLRKKNYSFFEVCGENILNLQPDIVFYQQPYDDFLPPGIFFERMASNGVLICDVHYSMRTLAIRKKNKWIIDQWLYRYCWQMYVENSLTAKFGKLSMLKGSNIVVTGMPIQDELMKEKNSFNNPWKKQTVEKKKIIYAPHHTIATTSRLLNLSCFLEVCDIMLELCKKYEDRVQFAFKPHPFLKTKLINYWGEEKTRQYYDAWANASNSQLEEGPYINLFKYSDAMIHDCDSFTLEYCFMKNPVMFLSTPAAISDRKNDLNEFGQKAFDLHTKGLSKEEIENFILNVINGVDNLKQEREDFYSKYLAPPNGRTASDNIMRAIIGADLKL